jgi:hypothetical protein
MNSGSAEARARLWLLAAVGAVASGVLVAGTVSRSVGGVVTVAGWALGIFALHTFGRLGRSASGPSKAVAPPALDEANTEPRPPDEG